MFTFVTLLRGWNYDEARPLGVSMDPSLVAAVAGHLAKEMASQAPDDPALAAVARGRQAALRQVVREAGPASVPSRTPERVA